MEEIESRLLHTTLKQDVYNRLMLYSQSLKTGRGHWDIGVAIERLLDYGEVFERMQFLETRIDMLESGNYLTDQNTNKEVKRDNPSLLGGHKVYAEEGEKNEN